MEVSRIKTPATIEELIALLMDENVRESISLGRTSERCPSATPIFRAQA